ncbi:hypothetical protein TSAR_016635 [Trichomalopsis sarcophagae]|uniref:Uncharacterized protein n=1 Tax=Trichomalopsis sarcophagae TaxID=543379 RepID=A0A232EMT3_9HYME|nr:hypothetical protein TSAR_016635 [Trichomalopsis sarcophagae]
MSGAGYRENFVFSLCIQPSQLLGSTHVIKLTLIYPIVKSISFIVPMIRHSGAIDDLMIRTLGLWDGPSKSFVLLRAEHCL